MIEGWKYFDLSVDTRNARLTPVDDVLEPSRFTPTALWSMNSLGRSAAAFIYRFDRLPAELERRAEERDSILRTDTMAENEEYSDLFVHARMEQGYLMHDIKRANPVVIQTPIEFTDDRLASVRIIAPDRILDNTYKDIDGNSGVCIEKVGYCRPTDNDPLEMLTERQEEILRAAMREGYYAIPRETSQEALGEHFGVKPQTIGEHLRKIESKLIERIRVGGGKAVAASPAYGTTRDVSG
jgi:hypothetical protein